jgi:hypothetical protein
MPEIVQHTMLVLCVITQDVTIGTNLALLHFMWMLVSGSLLPSRGAVFPALQAVGLVPPAVRRAWAALHGGDWHIAALLTTWGEHVLAAPEWQETRYDGYTPKAVDTTAFWRPKLRDCLTKHFHPQAGKALPAIVVGLIARVGRIKGQRVALPTAIVRPATADASEMALQATLLARVKTTLAAAEMPVFDAGFKIKALQAAGLARYLVRLAENFTARRNTLPPAKGKGPAAEYGVLVRPLARTRKAGPKTAWSSGPSTGMTWCCRRSKSAPTRPRSTSRPSMTRAFARPGCWRHRSSSLGRPGEASIGTAGPWNRSPWRASRCSVGCANSSLPPNRATVCPS